MVLVPAGARLRGDGLPVSLRGGRRTDAPGDERSSHFENRMGFEDAPSEQLALFQSREDSPGGGDRVDVRGEPTPRDLLGRDQSNPQSSRSNDLLLDGLPFPGVHAGRVRGSWSRLGGGVPAPQGWRFRGEQSPRISECNPGTAATASEGQLRPRIDQRTWLQQTISACSIEPKWGLLNRRLFRTKVTSNVATKVSGYTDSKHLCQVKSRKRLCGQCFRGNNVALVVALGGGVVGAT